MSIGHALISDALYLGLERMVKEYKTVFADECNVVIGPSGSVLTDLLQVPIRY